MRILLRHSDRVLVKDIDVVVRLPCRHAATRVSCAWAASSSRSYLCREARAPAAASALVPGLGATGRWAAGSFLAFHDYIALILRAILLQEVRAPHVCLISGKTLRKNVEPSLFRSSDRLTADVINGIAFCPTP
jgi:hypothetical protein